MRSSLFWFFLAIAACDAKPVLAFPENIRHGYLSCSACHIAPSGGGVTTAYGRAQSAAFMSSFSYKGMEQPDYGLFLKELPSWLALGGDTRYANVSIKGKDYKATRKFLMQQDYEIAVTPIPGVTIAASGGFYGEKRELEYRRNYLKLQLSDNLTFRAGRFTPTYGIVFPDHRLPTRSALGLGQGDETFNTEASLAFEHAELFVTGVFGNHSTLELGESESYKVTSDMVGIVSRASLYLGKTTVIGVSGMRLSSDETYRRALGAFMMTGINDNIYVMAEIDAKEEDEVRTNVATWKLGWELFRGFHTSLVGDVNDKTVTHGLQWQWLPFPHWEILAELKRSKIEDEELNTSLLMFHYYL